MIAAAIGISIDELQAHLFGLTLTAVHGDGRTASQPHQPTGSV